MLDIGGGHGAYSVAFCREHPELRATILDLPAAVAAAAPILAEEKMGSRVVHRAGDALTDDFGDEEWDLIFIAQLVHHFDAATNAAIVRHAAEALRPKGRLAILDVLRPASPNAARPDRRAPRPLFRHHQQFRAPGRRTRSPAGSAMPASSRRVRSTSAPPPASA